jgi:hypothetical protein
LAAALKEAFRSKEGSFDLTPSGHGARKTKSKHERLIWNGMAQQVASACAQV